MEASFEGRSRADQPRTRPDGGGASAFRSLIWIILVPLLGATLWLGLLIALRTTTPFEVTIGRSMEPMLHTGDLVILEGLPPGGVALGDVIPIKVSESDRKEFGYPSRVLHRVIDITMADGRMVIRTKGDNQDNPDPFSVPASDVHGRLKASVPKVGYTLFYLRSIQGRIAIGGLVLLFLLYEGLRWATDTAEELIDDGPVPLQAMPFGPSGMQEFTLAIAEYGVHLRSHTKVVQELGGTTEELRATTAMQQEVLAGLRDSVRELAEQIRGGGLATPPRPPEAASLQQPLPPPAAPPRPAEVTSLRQPLPPPAAPAPRKTHRGVEAAQALARPILLAQLRRPYFPRLEIAVQGFMSDREMLEFGAALSALPTVARLALDEVRPYGAIFSLDTLYAGLLMDRLRRMPEFSVHPMWAPDGVVER